MAKWWWVLLLLGGIALAVSLAGGTKGGSAPEPEAEQTKYIVMLKDPESLPADSGRTTAEGKKAIRENTESVVREMEEQGIEVTHTYATIGGFAALLTEDQKKTLEDDPRVFTISEDMEVRASTPTVSASRPSAS